MVKDRLLRLMFIPILGIVISYVSGILTYEKYTIAGIVGGICYFIFVSWSIWRGCQWIHDKVRSLYYTNQGVFSKISLVCFSSSLYATSVSGILGLAWLRFSEETFSWFVLNKFILLSIFAVIVFTLIYEILYLSKERELDTRIVSQLDHELTRVEMIALRNELDPHFIYNSLNTLAQFISTDPQKAACYNNKLAHLYQYFLSNNNKELVAARQEIDFIKEYFQLLQMVYDNRMYLAIEVPEHQIQDLLLIPCSLQLLVENAIKHNQFTAAQPLKICISLNGEHIIVRNTLNARRAKSSTKIGLKNLDSQYWLLIRKKVQVEKTDSQFMVKLPLIRNSDNMAQRWSEAV